MSAIQILPVHTRNLFAQWDADLDALRAQERRAALLAANAMLANATPEPRLAALEDAAPRNEFRGRPVPVKRVSRKAHRQSQDARWGARYLSPAVYTYLPAK